MSQHPAVEAKIAAELEEYALPHTPDRRPPRPLEFADLNRLAYLQAVIKARWLCSVLKGSPSGLC